ncbi:MAG: PEP-CTERM sorting domain-containing protein [Chthonomonas sp.]|nr:PEP-CTERM sorting domain-containing protein [Chthonomonas sp.]
MKLRLVSILAIATSISFAADMTADFSIVNGNPNGAWSYGYKSNLAGSFNALTNTSTVNFGSGTFDVWNTPLVPDLHVAQLTSGTMNGYNGGVGGVAVGETTMHGGPNGELSTTRFTVGASGLYNLSGFFKSGDALGSVYGNIDGYLYHNSTVLYSTLNTGVTQSFSLSSVSLLAGDTLDLMVGMGQDQYFYDTTPVNLTITAVPEPGTIAVLGLGAVALLRRRKSA